MYRHQTTDVNMSFGSGGDLFRRENAKGAKGETDITQRHEEHKGLTKEDWRRVRSRQAFPFS
jgi:hypothetical protein